MIMLFVILAAVFTLMNWVYYKGGKNYHLFMGLALACIALGMCGEYHSVALWVADKDWDSLTQVVPTIEMILWFSVGSFSFLNVLPAAIDGVKNRKAKKSAPKRGQRLGD